MSTEAAGAGFTGVEWGLRSPEELARSLTAGPGPGQAGELAAVWSAAAAELEAVASEYRRLAVELSADWVSEASHRLDDRSREVSDDVYALAARSRELADRAAGHAHDHTLARAAMPKSVETAVTARSIAALDLLGPGLAGVLTGAAYALENTQAEQRRAAARVMAEYEASTAPLAGPRPRPNTPRHLLPGLHPPRDAARSTTDAANGRTDAARPATGSTAGGPAPLLSLALPPAAPVAPVPSGAQVRPAAAPAPASGPAGETRPPESRSADRMGAGMPIAPIGAGSAAAAGGEDEHRPSVSVRPGAEATEVDDLYGLSVAVAPPVFGGNEQSQHLLPAAGRETS